SGCFAEAPKIEGGETEAGTEGTASGSPGTATNGGTVTTDDASEGTEAGSDESEGTDPTSDSESSSDSGTGPVELPDPLAHWTFDDGDARDESGNGYHGVFVGDLEVVQTPWGLGIYVCVTCGGAAVDVSSVVEDFSEL